MSLMLLWIEIWAACVLFAVAGGTWAMRCKRRWREVLLRLAAAILPGVPLGMAVAVGVLVTFVSGSMLRGNTFWWTLLMMVCYLAAIGTMWRAASRRDETGARRGESWSAWRLTTAWAVVMALIVMTWWNMELATRVEIQALRAEAGALALSAMPAKVPDSLNAALEYERADKLWNAALTDEDRKRDYLELDSQSAEVKGYLARQKKALEFMRRAAEMPGCYIDGALIQADPVQKEPWRARANLLALAAKSEAAEGKVEEALRDCRRLFGMAEHAGTTGRYLTGGLVSVAVDGLACKTTVGIMPAVKGAPQLEGFDALDATWARRMFAQALKGEESFGMAMLCDTVDGTMRMPKGASAQWEMQSGVARRLGTAAWIWWLRNDVLIYRDGLEKQREWAMEPYYQTAAKRQAFEDAMQPGVSGAVLSATIMPSLSASSKLVAEDEAMRDAVKIAAAATGYRLEHGGYPASVEDLVKGSYLEAVPTDPFDGKGMRYKKNGDGSVTIWSVGRDGKDDGGDIERKKASDRRPPDWGVILQAAK